MTDMATKYPKYYKRTPDGVTVIDTYALNQMFPVDDPSGCILHARKKTADPWHPDGRQEHV